MAKPPTLEEIAARRNPKPTKEQPLNMWGVAQSNAAKGQVVPAPLWDAAQATAKAAEGTQANMWPNATRNASTGTNIPSYLPATAPVTQTPAAPEAPEAEKLPPNVVRVTDPTDAVRQAKIDVAKASGNFPAMQQTYNASHANAGTGNFMGPDGHVYHDSSKVAAQPSKYLPAGAEVGQQIPTGANANYSTVRGGNKTSANPSGNFNVGQDFANTMGNFGASMAQIRAGNLKNFTAPLPSSETPDQTAARIAKAGIARVNATLTPAERAAGVGASYGSPQPQGTITIGGQTQEQYNQMVAGRSRLPNSIYPNLGYDVAGLASPQGTIQMPNLGRYLPRQ